MPSASRDVTAEEATHAQVITITFTNVNVMVITCLLSHWAVPCALIPASRIRRETRFRFNAALSSQHRSRGRPSMSGDALILGPDRSQKKPARLSVLFVVISSARLCLVRPGAGSSPAFARVDGGATLSSSVFFRTWIWLTCTPWRRESSATVPSSRTAASATLSLKVGPGPLADIRDIPAPTYRPFKVRGSGLATCPVLRASAVGSGSATELINGERDASTERGQHLRGKPG